MRFKDKRENLTIFHLNLVQIESHTFPVLYLNLSQILSQFYILILFSLLCLWYDLSHTKWSHPSAQV